MATARPTTAARTGSVTRAGSAARPASATRPGPAARAVPPAQSRFARQAGRAVQDEKPAAEPNPNAFNLDNLEREGDNEAGVFSFIHNRRSWTLSDPKNMDWQQLLSALANPFLFFRLALPAEDVETFLAIHMPTWKLNALLLAYQKHYGLPTLGEVAALPR